MNLSILIHALALLGFFVVAFGLGVLLDEAGFQIHRTVRHVAAVLKAHRGRRAVPAPEKTLVTV